MNCSASQSEGVFVHGSPICPELIEVPTTFISPDLPEGEQLDWVVSGVDIAQTLLGQNRPVSNHVEWIDLWRETPPSDRIVRSDFWANRATLEYEACAAWSRDGGIMQHRSPLVERPGFGIHRKLVSSAQAPAIRSLSPRRLSNLLWMFGKRELVFGNPDPTPLRYALLELFSTESTEYHVDAPTREHLESLGYME